jgi:hypothetical protein
MYRANSRFIGDVQENMNGSENGYFVGQWKSRALASASVFPMWLRRILLRRKSFDDLGKSLNHDILDAFPRGVMHPSLARYQRILGHISSVASLNQDCPGEVAID